MPDQTVDLVVSSGLSAVLPPAIGQAPQAIARSRRGAGFTSEPIVVSHRVTGERAGSVLSIESVVGTAVALGAEVVFVVGTGDEPSAPRWRRAGKSHPLRTN